MRAAPDWEERLWNLTHDIAVRLAMEAIEEGRTPLDAALTSVVLAAATVAEYRASAEQITED